MCRYEWNCSSFVCFEVQLMVIILFCKFFFEACLGKIRIKLFWLMKQKDDCKIFLFATHGGNSSMQHTSNIENKICCIWYKCWCWHSGGGTCIGKWYGNVLRSWAPFFRPVGAPYPTNLPSMCRSCAPHFQFLEKICTFSLVLAKISALKTPHFSRKISSLDPTFGNLCSTYSPKKVEPPCSPAYIWHATSYYTVLLHCILAAWS